MAQDAKVTPLQQVIDKEMQELARKVTWEVFGYGSGGELVPDSFPDFPDEVRRVNMIRIGLEVAAAKGQASQRERDAQIAERYQIPGHSVAEPQIAAIAAAIRASSLTDQV